MAKTTTIIREILKSVAQTRFTKLSSAQIIDKRVDALSDERVIEIYQFINSPAQLRDCGIDNAIARTRATVLEMISNSRHLKNEK